jgi:hypothetical protein
MGGPLYVMVPVMCTNCNYTWQFNAITSGVLERLGQEQPSDSAAPERAE